MKRLTVAVVLDDKEGMTLFGKRQSRDRVLISEFLDSVGDTPVFVSEFSRLLFDGKEGVTICRDPFAEATSGGACFIENLKLAPRLDDIETLIIYRWNRLYPSDVKFDVDPEKAGYKLCSVTEFQGSSHDKITKEIYRK